MAKKAKVHVNEEKIQEVITKEKTHTFKSNVSMKWKVYLANKDYTLTQEEYELLKAFVFDKATWKSPCSGCQK